MTVAAGAGKPEMPGQVRWVPPDELEVHPAARLVPPLSSGELAGLRADIAASGVAEPVCLGQDGRVVDGRHRLAVALELGLPKIPVLPAICPLGGEAEYALRSALHRRSLSLDQRAVVAHRLAEVRGAQRRRESARVASQVRWGDLSRTAPIRDASRPPDSRTLAARELGVSERRLRLARELVQRAPDLAVMVESGSLALRAAAGQLERRTALAELATVPKVDLPEGQADVWTGDFCELGERIPDGSASLVIADLPWGPSGLDLWRPLGKLAVRVLRPGGWLAAYLGHYRFPESLSDLGASAGLNWHWLHIVVFRGPCPAIRGRRIRTRYRPIALYRKPGGGEPPWMPDLDYSDPRPTQKVWHGWAQSLGPAERLIRRLAPPGSLVVDPTCGPGTFGLAALTAGCRFIGIERDPDHAATARARLAQAVAERDRQAQASA